MGFQGPLLLMSGLGAAAVSIPVILHFFFRSRYRTVPWAAMRFLLTSIEQTSRRLRFQELLLLLLRMAVLALLAFALARPISSAFRGAGQGEAIDAVFLFDTSFSMGVREGGATRLDRAREAALDLIERLPPYSTVQIIACSDRAWDLGPRVPANLDQARQIIHDLQLTHLATDFLPGVRMAQQILERRQLPNKELYVFSDMQKSGWEKQSAALTETLRQIGQKATVSLVRCGTKKPNNVAIIGITPEAGIPRPGERVGFAVLVKNTGAEPIRDVRVSLMIDGRDKDRESHGIKVLPPGDTRSVTLSARMGAAGLHVITAAVKQDDLEADNRFDQVILVRESVRLLVIDGTLNTEDPKLSSSHYLLNAVLAVPDPQKQQYYLQPTLVSPREAVPELLEKQDVCILANVAVKPDLKQRVRNLSPEFLDALSRFVREGHGLIIFAGDNVKPADYNEVLVQQHRLLPWPLTQLVQRPADNPLHFNRNSAELAVYQRFKEDKFYELFNEIRVWQAVALKPPATADAPGAAAEPKSTETKDGVGKNKNDKGLDTVTVALRYDDGTPAVLAHKVDAGEVLFFTTAANPGWSPGSPDPTWTTLPLFPFFPPLVHETINHLLPRQTQNYNATAGRPLNWYAPRQEASSAFALYQPDGKKRRLGLPTGQGDRPLLVLDDLTTAGIYHLVAVDPNRPADDLVNDPVLVEQIRQGKAKLGRPIAVTPDLSESADLEALTDDQIEALLGFPVLHATAGSGADSLGAVDRTQREWTFWILVAVLAATLCEALLAWFCGRPIGGKVAQ